jgi:hypothetical protein
MPVTSYELLQKGGAWLGAARNCIQWNFHNGSAVIWGSNDQLGTVSVKKIEEVAAKAVAAYINEDANRGDLIRAAEFALKVLRGEFAEVEGNKFLAITRLQNALNEIKEPKETRNVEVDRGMILLTTEGCDGRNNEIYLEPEVYEALVKYVNQFKKKEYQAK